MLMKERKSAGSSIGLSVRQALDREGAARNRADCYDLLAIIRETSGGIACEPFISSRRLSFNEDQCV
jgi:hypothetical protein